MFNGIIQNTGNIIHAEERDGGKQLRIHFDQSADLQVDESISINGVCQTVVHKSDDHFDVQVITETLRKTALGELKKGELVNLERSLRLSDRISGHFVQGHVDTTGKIISVTKDKDDRLYTIRYPPEFRNLIVGRGSIAIDGISLTIARESGDTFTVAVIPYTFEHTNLRSRKTGDRVNLEFDIFGKYVIRYMEQRE